MELAAVGRWRQALALTMEEVLRRYSPPPAAIASHAAYFGLSPVTRIQTPDGHFHFQADRVVLLYVNDFALQSSGPLTRAQLLAALGPPAETLQSRAGRANRQYVFPDQGVAFSATAEAVDFVEVFPPCELDAYKRTFYRAPAAFTR